ncbi:hypothetical protein FKM82_024054 [Ascaphus truei]
MALAARSDVSTSSTKGFRRIWMDQHRCRQKGGLELIESQKNLRGQYLSVRPFFSKSCNECNQLGEIPDKLSVVVGKPKKSSSWFESCR